MPIKAFSSKETLKPLLFMIAASPIFEVAYNACYGCRIIFSSERVLEIDLWDSPEHSGIARFQLDGDGAELSDTWQNVMRDLKETIIKYYNGKQTFSQHINEKDKESGILDFSSIPETVMDFCLGPGAVYDGKYEELQIYGDGDYCESFYVKHPEYKEA